MSSDKKGPNSDMELLKPLAIGDLKLKNRVCLAPLTRGRADPETNVPTDVMADYYAQRASGGLLIAEATGISPQGLGWYAAPGIWSEAQVEGWKKVTSAVHAKDGVIFLQLWHMGRQSHSSYGEVVSASAVACPGETTTKDDKKVPYETPRALRTDEIPGIIKDYQTAAINAKKAGFDGVEVHSANGYLLDQFLQSGSNQRTDQYGGVRENRVRLLLEVVEAVQAQFPGRVAVRLAPNGAFGGMGSEENKELFPYVASRLAKFPLAYLHVMDGLGFGYHEKCAPVKISDIRKVYPGIIMCNVGLTRDVAEGMLRNGGCELCCFGRLYMSNPDLPERFEMDWPLAPSAEYSTWFPRPGTAKGYTDFSVHKPTAAEQEAAKLPTQEDMVEARKAIAKLEKRLATATADKPVSNFTPILAAAAVGAAAIALAFSRSR